MRRSLPVDARDPDPARTFGRGPELITAPRAGIPLGGWWQREFFAHALTSATSTAARGLRVFAGPRQPPLAGVVQRQGRHVHPLLTADAQRRRAGRLHIDRWRATQKVGHRRTLAR